MIYYRGFGNFATCDLLCAYCTDRAFACAGTAIHACVGVDDIFGFAFAYCLNRAYGCASAAFGAIVGDNVCHLNIPLKLWLESLIKLKYSLTLGSPTKLNHII